jgi:hypothetical protein
MANMVCVSWEGRHGIDCIALFIAAGWTGGRGSPAVLADRFLLGLIQGKHIEYGSTIQNFGR